MTGQRLRVSGTDPGGFAGREIADREGHLGTKSRSLIDELHQRAVDQAQKVARIGSWAWDLEANLGTWTPELYGIFDRTPEREAFSHEVLMRLVHPDDRGALNTEIQRAVDQVTSFSFDFRGLLPDGSTRWFKTIGLVQSRGGVPVGIIGTIQDIDEHRTMVESLRRNQALLQGIMDNSPVPIYMKDGDGSYLFVNRAFEDAVPVSRREILCHSDKDLFPADVARDFRANDISAIERGTSIQREEIGVSHGEVRTYDSVKFPVIDGDGKLLGVCGISTDITERVRAEDARHDERERIASDVHDDSVQVMASVLLRLEAFETTLKDEDQLGKLAELKGAVRGSIDRLRNLMFDLKTELPEGELVPALRERLQRIQREHSLEFSLTDDLGHEPCRRVASTLFRVAQEAFMNILKHANATHIDAELKRIRGGVRMSIRDDGTGFKEIVEPTQWHLGLPSMRARIEKEGGVWRLNTSVEHGTEVRVWLPEPLGHRAPEIE